MKEVSLLALGKCDCGALLNMEDYQPNGVIDDSWVCKNLACRKKLNYMHFGRPHLEALYRTRVIGPHREWQREVPESEFFITLNGEEVRVTIPPHATYELKSASEFRTAA